MQLVRRGSAAAFEVVYDRHADAAFSLAYRICGQRSLAEDVVQEACLSLWRSGARYDRSRGSVRTWLLGIVHALGDPLPVDEATVAHSAPVQRVDRAVVHDAEQPRAHAAAAAVIARAASPQRQAGLLDHVLCQ